MPFATKTFDAAVELASAAKAMQGQVGGTFTLGTIIDPKSIRLGALLSALQRYYPEIDVHLQHGISGTVLQRLVSGQLDACFFLGPVADPQFKSGAFER
ncbi:DNA-binding transcriptional LysR family regulator [Paraburkholderia terricola]|jgi:DNA-binding transcriptional LysR family regulator|uniref:LysR substrate-binding domain-containing protein n=1 Tax=Paraburkholderia terricola TaxID=169427 RepID=UPI0028631F17|nr:LysR substrate-binding domain-containing protein [Paraburkholderia terricola]MDR6450379.1 DNA-binding transcriptional LysR family regulator [Paraburkholderia terricola]